MDSSDKLIRLIKSLSPTEKRYFRLSVEKEKKGTKAAFLKLYDTIEKATRKEKGKGQLLLTSKELSLVKNLSFNKRYLYEYLLKTLRSFHWESNQLMRANLMILEIAILRRKGLSREAYEHIILAKKIAKNFDLPLVYLHLLKIEIEVTRLFTDNITASLQKIDNLIAESKDVLTGFKDHAYVLGKRTQTNLLENFNSSEMPDHYKQKLTAIMGEKEMKLDENQLSPVVRIAYNEILGSHAVFVKKDTYAASKYYQKVLDISMQSSNMRKNNLLDIYPQLFNYCFVCFSAGRYDEVAHYVSVLKSNPFQFIARGRRSQYTDAYILSGLALLKLQLYTQQQEYVHADELDHDVKKLLQKNIGQLFTSDFLELLYFSSIYFFAAGQHSRSLYYLKKIIESKFTNTNIDYRIFALVYRSVIYFESGSHDKLEFCYNAAKRFIEQFQEASNSEDSPNENNSSKEQDFPFQKHLEYASLICQRLPEISSVKQSRIEITAMITNIRIWEKETKLRFNTHLLSWLESKLN